MTRPRAMLACIAVSSMLASSACGANRRPGTPRPEVQDELPPWMTEGEQVRLDVATKLLEQGNTISALDIIRGMRQEGYGSGEVDLLQGKALRIDGLVDESERLLMSADKKLKRDPRPATELCVLYADAGRLDEAIAQCERATSIDETSGQSWNNLGFLLLAAGRPDDALSACGEAVQLDSANPLFRNNMALAQAAVGRHEAAYQTFQSTLPRSIAAFNVGAALERFDDPEQALVYYERALSYDPSNADAVAARARLTSTDNDTNPSVSPAPADDAPESPSGDTP